MNDPELSKAPRRPGSRPRLLAAAAIVLATTALVTPAHGAVSSVAGASLPGATSDTTELLERTLTESAPRSAAELSQQASDAAAGLTRLESTPTAREGVGAARKPQIVKRRASLPMRYASNNFPPNEQNLARVEVLQDLKAKRITIDAPFYAPPTASRNSVLYVLLGRWTPQDTCQARVQIAALGHGGADDASILDVSTARSAGRATRALSGSTLRVTATGAGAADAGYECAFATLHEPLGPDTTQALLNSYAEDFEGEVERAPKFSFYSSGLTAAYPGTWAKVPVTIANDGNLVAKNVQARLSGKNLTFKKKKLNVGKIKAGGRKKITAHVKLKGKKTRTLKVRATAKDGWKASTKTKVGHRPHPTKVKSLAGRSYWASFTGSGSQNIWQVRGLHFDKKWAYVGNRPEGASPKCSAKVKKCFRYSYNRSTGQVKIGKIRGKVDSEGIRITKAPKKFSDLRKLEFEPLTKPKKNARLNVRLKYTDGRGSCIAGSCSSWWRNLHLKKNRTFTWTRAGISTVGIPPFQTFLTTSGPDYKGKYKVLKNGRIRFTFTHPDTGKRTTETHTIGIHANALGKHHPKHGLLIGAMPHL